MRRALAAFGVLLLVPATAGATASAPGDGTLSVKRGIGFVKLDLDRGAVIGRIERGRLTILNPKNDDCEALLVWEQGERAEASEKETKRGEIACIYTGRAMRFRIVGGQPQVTLSGRDISLSAVGRGLVSLKGDLTVLDAGVYSVDGNEYLPLPILLKRMLLGDGPLVATSA